VVRQAHLIAIVGAFLIGCADLVVAGSSAKPLRALLSASNRCLGLFLAPRS
jgi:hypothetical protein